MNLGAIERKYDPRDYKLDEVSEFLGQVTDIPETYTTNVGGITQNWQAQYPECGAHTASHLIQLFEENKVRISPVFIWKWIKSIDGHTPEEGTDMRSILKTLQSKGGCSWDLLPTDYSQTLAQHTSLQSVTEAMNSDAQPRIIESYAFGKDISFEGIKRDIYLHKAVVLLIHCDSGFFGTQYPTFTERKYGHFVLAIGYDKDDIIVIDSTEKRFPIKHISKDYIGFVRETGTAIDASNDYIKELVTKQSLLQQAITLTMKLFKKIK